MVERRTIHVPDLRAEPPDRFPQARALAERFGFCAAVGTPLLLEGQPIGNIVLRRMETEPFSDAQIRQLETFADQVVVAIENARLFEELERRNTELQESNRQVTEALEQQTVMGEVLRVTFNVGDHTVVAIGRVVWATEMDPITTDVGIEFVDIDPAMLRLLEDASRAADSL